MIDEGFFPRSPSSIRRDERLASVWVLAGFALTYSLWRSAALTRPDAIRTPAWWTYLAKVAGIALAIASLHFAIQPTTPAYPLAMMGFLWIAMAILSRRWSRLGKATALAIGGSVIAGGLALPLLVSGMDDMISRRARAPPRARRRLEPYEGGG